MKAMSEEVGSGTLVSSAKIDAKIQDHVDIVSRIIPGLSFLVSLGAFVLGMYLMPSMTLDQWVLPGLIVFSVTMQLLFLDVFRQHKTFEIRAMVLSILAFLFLYIYSLLPEYFTFGQINAIFHRSLFAAVSFLVIGPPAMGLSVFYFFKASPSAQDAAMYPLLFSPVALMLTLYFMMIYKIFELGMSSFDWEILTQPFTLHGEFFKTFIAGDWPTWDVQVIQQAGMLNHLKGTGLLILLTSLFSLPVGIGAGTFMSEYGETRFASIARFSINSLRAISLLILAFFAVSLVSLGKDSPIAPLISGTYLKLGEELISTGGSYVTASLVLSLVIIPVIARATEEGCRSTPNELREGSLALGASEELTLRRIVLPWALPNIVTSWLLGCVETAGSVAVLMFISFTGEYGVGPFRQVTSLAYYIFNAYFFTDLARGGLMRPYVYMAALLLLFITLGLGIAALLVKRWLVHRFRGG